jgi:hypothetical protein
MTILDDLFKEANALRTALRGTADERQRVVVDAAMVEIPNSELDRGRERRPFIPPGDTLIYNTATPLNSASFVGSVLTIFAPGLHASTGHGLVGATVVDSPDYGIRLATVRFPDGELSTAATETGTFVYFPLRDERVFVAVSLFNLRLE